MLAFRGTQSPDDAALDAYGVTFLEDAPAFPNSTDGDVAPIHGGFWRAWSRGAAATVTTLLKEQPAGLPLQVTGHSLGAALATIASHDLALSMLNGSLPSRTIDLVAIAKPVIGSFQWRVSFEGMLAHPATPFRSVSWYSTATDWAGDLVALAGVGAPGLGRLLIQPASADRDRWILVHETQGIRLPCCGPGEPCDDPRVRQRRALFLCHSSVFYGAALRRLAEPDDALATCQIYDANMMVAPDDSLNPMPALGLAICGDYREAIFGNAIRVR